MTGASARSFDDPAFFVRRPWVESQLEGWLSSDAHSTVALLTGSPGTGKSRYAYWLSKRLRPFKPRSKDATLGAVISRDQRTDQKPDDFSWPVLRDTLLGLSGRTTVPRITIRAPKRQKFGPIYGTAVGQMNQINMPGASEPEDELREVVLPALERLPEGGPIVVIIDGLDETSFHNARSFLKAVSVLTSRVAESARTPGGLGRLRVLLTSQPEMPVAVFPAPVCVDLTEPLAGDRDALEAHVYAVLNALDGDDRLRLAGSIAEQAGSVWMLAWYAAHAINIDVSDGRPVPAQVKLPPGLDDWYVETITKNAARDKGTWPDAEKVLAYVAAAQEVGLVMPADVSRAALGVRDGDFRQILRCARALLDGEHDELQLFHSHFGRWVINGGLAPTAVPDGHDVLADTLINSTGRDWAAASQYTRAAVAKHALCAAEQGVDRTDFKRLRDRCLDLLSDRERLAEDPRPSGWIGDIARLAWLCRVGTCLPGTGERLAGLGERLHRELEGLHANDLTRAVGNKQIHEMHAMLSGDEDADTVLIGTLIPEREALIMKRSRDLIGRLLEGRGLPSIEAPRLWAHAIYQAHEYERTRAAGLLDEAIDNMARALRAAKNDDPRRAAYLAGLAGTLTCRLDSDAAQPDDLSRAIALQKQVVTRTDLTNPPDQQLQLAKLLERRWEPDPAAHPDDLSACIAAYRAALSGITDDDPRTTNSLVRLAHAFAVQFIKVGIESGDLSHAIDVQRKVAALPNLDDPAQAWFMLGQLLELAGDQTGCVEAYRSAIEVPVQHRGPDRIIIILRLYVALRRRIGTDSEQADDRDRMIGAAREIAARPDLMLPTQQWLDLAQFLHDAGDPTSGIEAYRSASTSAPRDEPGRMPILLTLREALINRLRTGSAPQGDLDNLIFLAYEITAQPELDDPIAAWRDLAHLLQRKAELSSAPPYHRSYDRYALFASIEAWRVALGTTSTDHELRTEILSELSKLLTARLNSEFEQADDLDSAIALGKELVTRPDITDAPTANYNLARLLHRRWQRRPESHPDDLIEGIAALRRALPEALQGYAEAVIQTLLANMLFEAWLNRLTGTELNDAVAVAIEVMAAHDADSEMPSLAPTLIHRAHRAV